MIRRRRFYLIVHHYVGRQSFNRDGAFGIVPFFFERLLFSLGRVYFVSNRGVKNRISAMNPKARIELTQNGFDSSLLSLEPALSHPPFILFMGRFDIYMKGLDILIPAYAEAAAAKGIDLVLAGRASVEDAESVLALIPKHISLRVRLESNISDSRKAELLASCLFFCSPSRFEGFGIAALEANAAGKAALVTDADGFCDSLSLGETALAVSPNDLEGLKSAMARLIENSELRQLLGRRGREHARAFSWDAIAEKEWGWIQQAFLP